MRKLLKFLMILQIHHNTNDDRRGKGFNDSYRFNPYNPLSYITIILFFIVGIIMFGVVGIWKEMDLQNPFKWN